MIHSSAARREEILTELRNLETSLDDQSVSDFLSDAFLETDVSVRADSFTPGELEVIPVFFKDAPRPAGGVAWELSREFLLNSLNDSRVTATLQEKNQDARRDRELARQAVDAILSRII